LCAEPSQVRPHLPALAVGVEFFLAGTGAFAAHRGLGYLIVLLALMVTIVGGILRVPARLVAMAALATGLILLQPVIAGVADALGDTGGTTTAGRPVFGLNAGNGLVIVAVLGNLLRPGSPTSPTTGSPVPRPGTSRSAWSTRPPASCCANSSSTPPRTTSHSAANPARRKRPEMQRCPATPANGVAGHHIGRADRI
jgi:hypothetical protein